MISKCNRDLDRAAGAAIEYLGPELQVISVVDNTSAPLAYGEVAAENCWRAYFAPRMTVQNHVGGDSPYILIEKESLCVIGRGIERGE
jgi:hypothetical protein